MILEAASLVYYEFWGGDLDKILQPVPNCGNFKYLSEKQIDSLKLHRLLYREAVLLAREEYEVAFKDLWSYKEEDPKSRGGGVVVTGQEGIGMHHSLTTLLR